MGAGELARSNRPPSEQQQHQRSEEPTAGDYHAAQAAGASERGAASSGVENPGDGRIARIWRGTSMAPWGSAGRGGAGRFGARGFARRAVLVGLAGILLLGCGSGVAANSTNATNATSETNATNTTNTTAEETTGAVAATTTPIPEEGSNHTISGPCGIAPHSCVGVALPDVLAPAPTSIPANVTVAPRAEPEGTDLGPCICDMTRDVCDANCACDGKCSAAEAALFTEDYGYPTQETSAANAIPLCLDRDLFLRINAETKIEDSPFCVLTNNNPATGTFFLPTASVTSDEIRVEFSTVENGAWAEIESPHQPSSGTYQVGMRLPVAWAGPEVGSVGECVLGECVPGVFFDQDYLAMPYPGPGGECKTGSFIRYFQNHASSEPCSSGGPIETACAAGTMLDAGRLLGKLFIAKQPPGQVETWAEPARWLRVSVSVTVEVASGQLFAVPTADGIPSPQIIQGGALCANALKDLQLNLVRDGNGILAEASAVVTLRHTPPDADGQLHVPQTFRVSFLDAKTKGLGTPLEQATLSKSGAPGYRNGLPVLAGIRQINATSLDGAEVIRKLLAGLALPRMAAADGSCSVCPSGTAAGEWGCTSEADARDQVPVLFNVDMRLGCSLKLTRKQLKSFCNAQSLHPLLRYDVDLRLGIWGDSEPASPFDWVPKGSGDQQLASSRDNPASAQSFDERGNCTNVVDSIHFQVLTADVGNVANAQQKILGARVLFRRTHWTTVSPDDTSEDYYPISASVTFHRMPDGGSVEVMPPPPSVLPILDDDLFYPFSTGAAPSSRPLAPLTLTLLPLLLSAALVRFL